MYNIDMNHDIILQTLQDIHDIQGPSRILCVYQKLWSEELITAGACVVYMPRAACIFIAVTDELATLITLRHSEAIWQQWSWEEFQDKIGCALANDYPGPMQLESSASGIATMRRLQGIRTQLDSVLKTRRTK